MKIELVQVCRRPQWPLWAVLIVLAWLALGGTALLASSHLGRLVPLCLLKRFTGLACPTCGFTRGVLCLLDGRPGRAWLYNPLLFSVLGLFVAATGIRILFARAITIRLARTERGITWLLAGILFVANWAYIIFYVG